MTCHITGGFSLPEGARERSIQLFADDRVARGHLIGQILQMWRRSQALSRRRAVVHVIGHELQHNSVKRAWNEHCCLHGNTACTRATFSFRWRVARRRRPLHHCRRPGRCRRAMHRIQRLHWRPCRGAPLRPPRLMTAGGRCCAHPAQMAPAHHGVEHIVCGHTTEKWSPRLIASSTLFVDARRSSKTPRPEKVTKVERNCTEK